jgi:beta-lactam-binding protein with PASTA domain
MTDRYDEVPPDEVEVTEVTRERRTPPPWWRENWWIWGIVLLLLVGALIAFFALRDAGDEEAADEAVVPAVLGLSEAEARETLEREGLEGEVTDREESEEPEGTVIGQTPGAGTQLPRGAVVELVLSAGEPEVVTETETVTETEEEPEPEMVEVPDVVGTDHVDAGATVDETGLIANSFPVESTEERGTVVGQNPDPGTQLPEGERVRLNVSLGEGEREAAEVPDVTGEDEVEARQILRDAGFTVRTLDRAAPEPGNVGEVILQRPEPRSAPVLTQVTIYVGR